MTSGLSILIPVFNWPVEELINSLLAQRPDWPGPVEILLLDDGSREEFRALHRSLARLPGVHYRELPANVGRAAIRNQLAAAAQHEWLLLLDNDSLLPDAQFLARYAAARHRGSVLIGGTCYAPTPPADATLRLRWEYGRSREARPAAVRQRQPYAQLTINNALVRAAVLRRFPLDERLRGYGHEDTAFGEALAAAGVPVVHLENPVLHAGLEPAELFLAKSEEAVRSLVAAFRQHGTGADSRLLRTALRLRALGLAGPAQALLRALAPRLRRNLHSATPQLRALDLLKLRWLLELW